MYILLLIFLSVNSAPTVIEFNTKATCERARYEIMYLPVELKPDFARCYQK